MITCDILGPGKDNCGLGNQLFCIATTLALAEENQDTATFPQLNFPPYDFYGNTIFHKLNKFPTQFNKTYVEESWTSTVFNKIKYQKNMRIRGHFQSYKYFDHIRKKLLSFFQLPDKITKQIDDKYAQLLQKSNDMVSLHVRRGDYLKLDGHYASLTNKYYQDALDLQDNNQIVVFSDDIEWCKKNITFDNREILFVEKELDIVDLYLMSKIKNNILANSTFSWWGAYLNENEDKKVIAPKDWFGPKRTKSNELETQDLMPPDWIRI